MSAATDYHLGIMKHVFRYLKYTRAYEIYYEPKDNDLRVYFHADIAITHTWEVDNWRLLCFVQVCIHNWKKNLEKYLADQDSFYISDIEINAEVLNDNYEASEDDLNDMLEINEEDLNDNNSEI